MSGTYHRHPLAAWSEIDGIVVIVAPRDSVLHELNETASTVWKCLDGRDTGEIAAEMANVYDIDQPQAHAHVEELLRDLQDKNLVVDEGQHGER